MFAINVQQNGYKNNELKRWSQCRQEINRQRLGFISYDLNDMNLENTFIKLFLIISFTRLVIFQTDNGTSGRVNVFTFNSDIPNTHVWSARSEHS